MGASEISAAWTAAQPMIEGLIALGLPGIALMVAAIPALVIVIVYLINQRHIRHLERVLENYRADTQRILHEMERRHGDMEEKHAEVAEFYRKNVTLVKNYEKNNDLLQTLIVNNTRAMEHLSTIIEHRSIS